MSIIYLIALAQSAGVAPQAPIETRPSPPPVQQGTTLTPPAPLQYQNSPATPLGNPGAWVTADDYPTLALRQGWQGIVGFRLTISPGGAVQACDITRSSGYAALDEATCNLLTQRARFRPARDPNGQAVTGSYSNRVRWELPEDSNPFADADGTLSPMQITWRFFIEPDGTTSDCVVSDGNTTMQLAEPGSPCGPEMHYKPFTDANGKPVRKRVFYRMEAGLEPDPKR